MFVDIEQAWNGCEKLNNGLLDTWETALCSMDSNFLLKLALNFGNKWNEMDKMRKKINLSIFLPELIMLLLDMSKIVALKRVSQIYVSQVYCNMKNINIDSVKLNFSPPKPVGMLGRWRMLEHYI